MTATPISRESILHFISRESILHFTTLHYPAMSPVADGNHLIGILPSSNFPEGVFAILNPATGSPANNTEETYEEIVAEADNKGLSHHRYHVFSYYNLFVTDDITWTQITPRDLH